MLIAYGNLYKKLRHLSWIGTGKSRFPQGSDGQKNIWKYRVASLLITRTVVLGNKSLTEFLLIFADYAFDILKKLIQFTCYRVSAMIFK